MGTKMKIRTIKRILIIFLINHIFAGMPNFEMKRKLLNMIGISVGVNTKVVGPIFCSGQLSIGENCWIGKNFTVNGNGSVSIEDNCDIAPEVTFLTGGHKIGEKERRAGEGEIYSVHVKSGCWLGARSTILGNIIIEKGSVVAAGALVRSNVDENTLVGGVPAKYIKDLD